MPIFIYNSLTRKKEEFIPLKTPKLNFYTCGVTVYDESHIGHARSLFIFDLIRRYLSYRKFKVRFVRNITDIDDKIINRANELKLDWKELVSKYIASYYRDLASLSIEKADFEPRATENIPSMVEYIKSLIDKGFAYEAGGDVYFDVKKYPSYGKLSGQSISEMEHGARISPSENKRDPLDFALWKSSKAAEPSWESPWGRGRPGWHIECSVMSQKFLGVDTLDIHAGGRDLIFPHHENEIAQAQALTGKPFARYWIHHGLLTINNQKMSKSLGNFVTIRDFILKYGSPDLLKLFFLSAHYSHPVDYSEAKIEEARQARERIMIFMDKAEAVKPCFCLSFKRIKELKAIENRFIASMDDDFNTPGALACVFELVSLGNKNMDKGAFVLEAKRLLSGFLKILNIDLKKPSLRGIVEEAHIAGKIKERNDARKSKDYALSDRIRRELEEQGIVLEDAKDGTTSWRRKV